MDKKTTVVLSNFGLHEIRDVSMTRFKNNSTGVKGSGGRISFQKVMIYIDSVRRIIGS